MQFLLFAADRNYDGLEFDWDMSLPFGWNGFVQAFATFEEAKDYALHRYFTTIEYYDFQIVDLQQLKIVYESENFDDEIRPVELPPYFDSFWEAFQGGLFNLETYAALNKTDFWEKIQPIIKDRAGKTSEQWWHDCLLSIRPIANKYMMRSS
jgi:hypothetical protein